MSEPGKNIINDTILSSAQSGDNKQTEALIRQYRNVVEAIAAKYINSPLEYDDIRRQLKHLTTAKVLNLKPMPKPALIIPFKQHLGNLIEKRIFR